METIRSLYKPTIQLQNVLSLTIHQNHIRCRLVDVIINSAPRATVNKDCMNGKSGVLVVKKKLS